MNIRNYTSIDESKKLLELGLSPETADMCLIQKIKYPMAIPYKMFEPRVEYVPCWSVGQLLELMPFPVVFMHMIGGAILWTCELHFMEDEALEYKATGCNIIDVCVESMEYLLQNNYIKTK